MLPQKFFENLHPIMAILELLNKFHTNFDFILECFANYAAFCTHIFDCACLRCKAYWYQRGLKLWKNCRIRIKNIFENGWWEDAYPSSYLPVFAPDHKL